MPTRELTIRTSRLVVFAGLLAGILSSVVAYAEPGLTVETETEVQPVSGDVLSLPEQEAPVTARAISLPAHGMSMTDVQRRYGSPAAKHSAVGKPPITRWDYEAFSVFFEYHTVLHAVQYDKPAEIQRKDELQGQRSSSSYNSGSEHISLPDTSSPP